MNYNKCAKRMLFAAMGIILLSGILCGRKIYAGKISPLKVKGTYIVNEKGRKVTLRGASTHGIAWFPQYVNNECFRSLKKMGANTIRLAFYSAKDAGYDTSLYSVVEKGIEAATELGMYVIVDWHILSDGNPSFNQKNAEEFFRHFASKYSDYGNILYEICNEPNGDVTWERDIRPYADKMIKLIRNYNEDAVIIVGTPTWSQDVDIVSNNPLPYDNILYSLHFYAATHSDWNRDKLKKALDNKLPVIVSEFSICDASGNGSINKAQGRKWIKLLDRYRIGRIVWSICNKNETASLLKYTCTKTGKFSKKDLSKTGRWIVNNW